MAINAQLNGAGRETCLKAGKKPYCSLYAAVGARPKDSPVINTRQAVRNLAHFLPSLALEEIAYGKSYYERNVRK